MAEINWKDKCWVATCYLVRPDGKVLLSWNKNIQAWIPVGGHIEPGETPDDAVRREVAEETGFEFEFVHPPHKESQGKVTVLKPHRVQIESVPHHNKHINVVFLGRCTRWSDERTMTDEQEKLKWFSQEELLANKSSLLENVFTTSLEAIQLAKTHGQSH